MIKETNNHKVIITVPLSQRDGDVLLKDAIRRPHFENEIPAGRCCSSASLSGCFSGIFRRREDAAVEQQRGAKAARRMRRQKMTTGSDLSVDR